MAAYTGLGFLAAVPVVLIPNAVARFDVLFAGGVSPAQRVDLLLCAAPLVTAYALPIAFVFGLMMALGRLSDELELTALRSGGVGTGALLAPLAALGVAISVLTFYLMADVEPRAKRELQRISLAIASSGGIIEPGRFQTFGDRVVFARRRRPDRSLEGVMIVDRSDAGRAFQVFAERGRFDYDRDSGLVTFVLNDVDVRVGPTVWLPFEDYRLSFSEFDYRFYAHDEGAAAPRYRTDQLGLPALRAAAASLAAGDARPELRYRDARIYQTQIQRVFALPLAPALFALLGVPLALGGFVRSRAWGLLLALALFGGYYALFFWVQDLALLGVLPPPLAIWTPDVALAVVAAGLLWDSRRVR